ncbi:MAG: peptidoglycan DD-metalloendopeptidase family protein, partial [Leeuwenhoekiella sp.]
MSVDRTPEELLIKSLTASFVPLLDTGQENDNYFHLDLSINNEELQAIDISSSQSLGGYVNSKLAKNNAAVGYGGYAERRDIYSRSAYFNQNNPDTQRNIHLGIDLWCAAGTSVLAAYDGTVHSFKDNRNYGDYGPCVILKHDVKGFIFFSLYGHLSKETLEKLTIDQKVIAGEPIGH